MPRLRGNNHDNVLTGGNGNDIIDGRGGNDRIDGGLGNDTMNGGDGNDILISNAGNDIMTGGSGADTFVIGPRTNGTITITDFENGVDHIDLTAFGFNSSGSSSDWFGFLIADGADTVLDFYGVHGENFQIVLQNFDYTNIDITDYILGP
ncbi:MAG: hypothetical protein KF779_18370 [Hyphomonadaceae bacterium]|nr:hypothetical protein [Hyphomonadaceae bacterium]